METRMGVVLDAREFVAIGRHRTSGAGFHRTKFERALAEAEEAMASRGPNRTARREAGTGRGLENVRGGHGSGGLDGRGKFLVFIEYLRGVVR